jgi:hypothetical protein
MLDWLKRTLGAHGLTNSDGVPDDVIDTLARDFARLKGSSNAALPEIALKYVVDGVGDAPKAVASVINSRGVSWASHNLDEADQKIRSRIYDAWDRIPPEVLIRFGSVLAASSSAVSNQPRLLLAQKHPWLEALALELLGLPVSHMTFQGITPATRHPMASMARLETLLECRSVQRSELVASTFRSVHTAAYGSYSALQMREMPGFAESVRNYADAVRPAFSAKSFEHRVYALNLLENVDAATLEPFATELVALSLDSSRRVRQAAVPLALRLGSPALSIARHEAEEQKPEQRALALRLLWESGDPHEREFVIERGDRDTSESVRKSAQQLRSGAEVQENAKATLQIPEVKADLSVPLSAESRDALRATLQRINDLITQRKRQVEAQNPQWAKHWKSLSSGSIDTIVRQVAEPARERLVNCEYTLHADADAIATMLAAWIARNDVGLTHVVRLLISMSSIQRGDGVWHDYLATRLLQNYGQRKPDASVLELAALLEACGVSNQVLMREWYGMGANGFLATWPREAIWPFFAHHRDLIDVAFNPPSSLAREYWFNKARVFDALETFPEVPADVVPRLMELALGGGKTDRNGAQRALQRLPGKEDYIIEALTSGKAETRAVAANWLAQLRHREAIPPLERALAKEKHDVAAGALMSALEVLGTPVDRFLNRGKLQEDAKRALAKGVPADLSWFPFDGLPQMHWEDTGEVVPDESLRWLIVQSCKLKSPEPGGVLRRYCASMRAPEREAIGVFVLNAWIREDVKPIARADAEKKARDQAQQMFAHIKKYPQYYEDEALKNSSEDQLYETYLPGWLRQPAGSAIGSKGVLAVAAACGGPDIAPMVQRYLKEYYGTRAAQGKALIQMLAWVEHPTAIQLVLSVGSRFRTKSFQEEAIRQAQLLAERKGWTLDELSDRTIPTAGFDEAGESVINYGVRQFTARLTADFAVELYTAEGRKISNLPDARKDEDESSVKELKKQFSAAKKELKGVLQLQRDRLYEGLCTQRRWRAEDWTLYLNRHPVVRRYCQRLVWVALREDQAIGVFRPLDDGTLTDVEDNAFELPLDAQVALAHDSNLTPPVAAAWARHLQDYKVEPLFQQFGKDAYRLPAQMREASQLEEFKGYVLDAFTLRNRIGKLGYTRGAAEDGGWFYRYEKRFPTLGLTVNIEFTGNGLPEENRKVALVALWFARSEAPGSYGVGKLPLGEIPGVLLSECWNDMRLLAAEGAFDADWEKKIQV